MRLIEDIYPEFQQDNYLATRVQRIDGAKASNRAAVNATATLTAAQFATGYITSTSASATTITLPGGTIATACIGGLQQGDTFDLWIDNSAGASLVTVAANTGTALSFAGAWAGATAASVFGLLTVGTGATGIGRFTFCIPNGGTAATFSRTY